MYYFNINWECHKIKRLLRYKKFIRQNICTYNMRHNLGIKKLISIIIKKIKLSVFLHLQKKKGFEVSSSQRTSNNRLGKDKVVIANLTCRFQEWSFKVYLYKKINTASEYIANNSSMTENILRILSKFTFKKKNPWKIRCYTKMSGIIWHWSESVDD